MYTLTHIDLDNNTKKNVTLRDLKEYHHFSDKIHDVKELEHSPIANNIDFSIGVLEPLDGAEDFVYVYLNRPVVKFGDKTDNIIGRSYKDLFSNVKEFNSFDCLMRAWNENRRINTIVLIYKDNNTVIQYQMEIQHIPRKTGYHLSKTMKSTLFIVSIHLLFIN